jgi:hypothetical protein
MFGAASCNAVMFSFARSHFGLLDVDQTKAPAKATGKATPILDRLI